MDKQPNLARVADYPTWPATIARPLVFVTAIILLAVLPACCGSDTLQAEAIAPTSYDIFDRHDRYVRTDRGLDPTERSVYLRDTDLLRQLFQEAGQLDPHAAEVSGDVGSGGSR